MFHLTSTERKALVLIASVLLVGQGLLVYQRGREARYLYRESDREFWAAFQLEQAAAKRQALEARVIRPAVNPNTASREELQTLPGVGPVIADRIMEYRREHPLTEPEGLRPVPGIGPQTLEKMRPYLVFTNREEEAEQ